MLGQEAVRQVCPYCGEPIELLIESAAVGGGAFADEAFAYDATGQQYIEDCQVCCRPINVRVEVDASGETHVSLTHENE